MVLHVLNTLSLRSLELQTDLFLLAGMLQSVKRDTHVAKATLDLALGNF